MLASVTPGSLPWVVVACPRSSSPLACHHFKVVTCNVPTVEHVQTCSIQQFSMVVVHHDDPWYPIICNLWFYWCQCGPSDFLHNDAVWFHRSLGQIPQLLPTHRLCTEKEHAATVERLPLPVNPSKDRDLKFLALRRSKRSEKIHIPSSYVFPYKKERYCRFMWCISYGFQ